ncbi:MAG: 50S ribosomal protein L24 [Candidatus Omnitrophica bacterium]|nr:50S ribosomal protein L24 [Candidatus Omnitrophota bacterium]
MLKIKKGDTVKVLKGKDRGKTGKVLTVYLSLGKALVEGINLAKKHKKQTRQEEKGGIVSIEMPLSIANIALVCKSCNRTTRVGFSKLKDATKTRICKACKEAL